mgnify:CR=1 FL=1
MPRWGVVADDTMCGEDGVGNDRKWRRLQPLRKLCPKNSKRNKNRQFHGRKWGRLTLAHNNGDVKEIGQFFSHKTD